jgi:sec-independent protein translocase protein TatA
MLFYFFGLGLWELLIILFIILLFFGGKKLPEIGSGLARGIKGFRKSLKESDQIDITPKESEDSKEGPKGP